MSWPDFCRYVVRPSHSLEPVEFWLSGEQIPKKMKKVIIDYSSDLFFDEKKESRLQQVRER